MSAIVLNKKHNCFYLMQAQITLEEASQLLQNSYWLLKWCCLYSIYKKIALKCYIFKICYPISQEHIVIYLNALPN